MILIVLITILVIRSFIAIAANVPALQFIFHDQSYHFIYGLALMVLALIFRQKSRAHIGFGIGFGLFVDDLAATKYVFTGPAIDPVSEYWSALFVIPLLVGIAMYVLVENKLQRYFGLTLKEKNSRPLFNNL